MSVGVLRALLVLTTASVLAACGGAGSSVGSAPAPVLARSPNPGSTPGTGSTHAPGATPSATAAGTQTPQPGTSATPQPGTSATPGLSGPTPSATSSADLTCDTATYPSTAYVQCEATNYAMVTQDETEQAMPAFVLAEETQDGTNMTQWADRALADPSWLYPQSGNTPYTPVGTQWSGPATGDPFRFEQMTGPDGSTFYTTQAVVTPFVAYDSGCARMSGRVWAPASSAPGDALPNVVIENGSVEAPETLYWWAAQALVRAGYVVLTFDPRGQGRSDEQTPTGTQGGNINDSVFESGLVDAIDFFRSTPSKQYPNNTTCKGVYPTTVVNYNPYWNRIDPNRLGIAGHSEGAIGVSIVQGYGGAGAAQWPGKIDATNPVKVAVAWDGLFGPAGGDVGGIGNMTTSTKFTARVPAMGNSSEYGLTPTPFTTPPPIDEHKDAFSQWVKAGTPVYELTIRGSSHYEFSEGPGLPATSWCPNPSANECENGWGNAMSTYYTVAWFDRWLKLPGEYGYADADARLLDDNGEQGRNKMSWHFHSARSYPDRNGVMHVCSNIRGGCADTGLGPNRRPSTAALRASAQGDRGVGATQR